MEPETAGNPMNAWKWIRSSLRNLSEQLSSYGYSASPPTISRLLKKQNYSLKVNRKEKEGHSQHPDRDQQFVYINAQREDYRGQSFPIISIDTKKKELIGEFKNNGKVWCLSPEKVNVHDFPSDAEGRASPYGIYELGKNKGYVYVGKSADTAEFAVDAIEQWWREYGFMDYPGATELLILADSGGSNGARIRLWKKQIQERLSDQFGLNVKVCHYPPGCSKWNPIEHRLFSHISQNWAGKPLRNYASLLGYINGTKTSTGLTVKSFLIEKDYTKGKKISDKEMNELNIEFHNICPKWNYTIRPRIINKNGGDAWQKTGS